VRISSTWRSINWPEGPVSQRSNRDVLYAILMLLTLAALRAMWQGSGLHIPLVLLAAVATVTAFVSDITTVLSISL